MQTPEAVLNWLTEPDEPSVRYGVMVDLQGEPADSARARRARGAIRRSERAQTLLSGQQEDGTFGRHAYSKWRGGHWRLLRLADLNFPRKDRAVKRALQDAFRWALILKPKMVAGRPRRCASQQGAVVFYSVQLGYGDDPRVRTLVDRLLEWQWPDGGWNCDKRPQAHHSSFHETLLPLWGLAAYWRFSGDPEVKKAMDRAAELFLCHRLFRRDHDPEGSVIHHDFVRLHYPTYWHYDILDACRALALAGKLGDPRTNKALDLIESKRREDGTWTSEYCYWSPPSTRHESGVEAVRWARPGRPDKFLTLNALRVLKAAGRLSV